jgi:hypothetical protein
MRDAYEQDREDAAVNELNVIVGVCREDNPADVDEAYGSGTYARLFPDEDDLLYDARKEYGAMVQAGMALAQVQIELTKVEGSYSSPAFRTVCHALAHVDRLADEAFKKLRGDAEACMKVGKTNEKA